MSGDLVHGEVVTPSGRPGRTIVVPQQAADPVQYARDHYLPPGAAEMVVRGIPPNTLATYTKAWRRFRMWCEDRGRTYAPTTEETMIAYLHEWERLPIHTRCKGGRQRNGEPCGGHRPSPSSMWIWYSAVRFYHAVGRPPLPWECGESLTRAMIAYSNALVDGGWTPAKAPRAYPSDVTRMVDALDLSHPRYLRDRAVILTNFYSAARASDLRTYRLADVEHFPRGIRLVLRKSKTNRSVGKKVETREIFANDANPRYCGVEALHSWMDWLRSQGIRDGALFRPFSKPHTKDGVVKPGVLLRGARDALDYKMDVTSMSEIIQHAAKLAALPNAEDYTCHSLRRGRATQQRELGADPLDIARAYGWVPGGAINVYLEEAERESPEAVGAKGLL